MQRRKINWIVEVPEEPSRNETVEEQITNTKDEREDVQKKTFAKWINSQLLKNHHEPISDLFIDLRDGNRLLSLLEVLTSKVYKRERGRMRVHHLNNVNKALQILEQNNVKLVNISSNDIVDGNPKLTLGLVWSIILHWQTREGKRKITCIINAGRKGSFGLYRTLNISREEILSEFAGHSTKLSSDVKYNNLKERGKSVARKKPDVKHWHIVVPVNDVKAIREICTLINH